MPQVTHAQKTAPQVFEVTVHNIKDSGNETRHIEFHFKQDTQIDFWPGPDWKHEQGYAQALIQKSGADPAGKRIYICGINQPPLTAKGFGKTQRMFC